MMLFLLTHIRALVYILTAIIAVVIFGIFHPQAGYLSMTIWYGFFAMVALYVTLLISPLTSMFPNVPGKNQLLTAQKAFGFSALALSLPHAYLGFYALLGGWSGVLSRGWQIVISLGLGVIALILLALFLLKSSQYFETKLGKWWQPLHQLTYLSGIIVFIHGITATIHVLNVTMYISVAFLATWILMALEIFRFDAYLQKMFPIPPRLISAATLPVASLLLFWSFFMTDH